MNVTFFRSLLNVMNISLTDAGISSVGASPSKLFNPRFFRSKATFLRTAALGSSLGNIIMKNANPNKNVPKIIHPSHQAPNHLNIKPITIMILFYWIHHTLDHYYQSLVSNLEKCKFSNNMKLVHILQQVLIISKSKRNLRRTSIIKTC